MGFYRRNRFNNKNNQENDVLQNRQKTKSILKTVACNENIESSWDEDDEAWLQDVLASESKSQYVQRMRKHFQKNNLPIPDCLLDLTGANVWSLITSPFQRCFLRIFLKSRSVD